MSGLITASRVIAHRGTEVGVLPVLGEIRDVGDCRSLISLLIGRSYKKFVAAGVASRRASEHAFWKAGHRQSETVSERGPGDPAKDAIKVDGGAQDRDTLAHRALQTEGSVTTRSDPEKKRRTGMDLIGDGENTYPSAG